MTNLLVASLFLIGTHFGISSTQIRDQLVAAIGERAYLGLYSLVAIVALIWLVMAWRAAPWIQLWPSTPALRHVPILVMPPALLLVVCALSQPNPTAVGQAPDADAARPAYGIVRVTRHPFMWGVGLWALAHMAANGDRASLLFFGTFAVLALAGTTLIDAKRSRRNEPGWGVFLQSTSNLPFAAILDRRQKLVPREIGLARVAAALGLYVLLVMLHPWLFGVPALG
ncbi:MAG TPA: NnrU family protein [Geminicoccaceae bacterium]|nr:NnrU family protein [Geminicoccaceae bacterium]